MHLRTSALLLLFLAAFATGCGGKYFRPYLHNPGALTMVTREDDGLVLNVDPLLDLAASKTNFGMDCHKKGILPVYLMVTNANATTSYRIVAREIWFGVGTDNALHTKSGLVQTNTSAAGSGLAVAGGVVVGISAVSGLVIAGFAMKATDDAESIRENFVIKQFQNINLAPGKSAEGFVYYGQTNPISPSTLPSINIPVHNLQTDQTNTFSFPLAREL